jgi:AhpC/TSA family
MGVQEVTRRDVAVVLLSMGLGLLPLPTRALEVGDQAPDFLLHSTMGETVRLSDYQGKKHVLLFFFQAAFTGV